MRKDFGALLLSANCYCGRRKCLYLSSLCVTSFVSLPAADGKREPVMLYKHYKPHNVERETNITQWHNVLQPQHNRNGDTVEHYTTLLQL